MIGWSGAYLRNIMGKLGLAQGWIDTVVSMISSVSFSVLFNGEKLQQFTLVGFGREIQSPLTFS